MSYPMYPPYHQDSSPYPRREYGAPYPQSNAPYPQQQPTPYPPQQPGVYPPSLGYGVGAPIYMPQPYGGIHSSYPPQQPPPPSTNPGGYYPPQAPPSEYPNYPPTQTHYNQSTSRAVPSTTNHETSPTVIPANPFDPYKDAEMLHKAMKGLGTDEKAIIKILCHRTNLQRLEIATNFKTLYGKDLIKELKSELSGNFEDLIVAMMTPLQEFYAKELHHAICGLGTNEKTLIEILCTLSNNEIQMIRHAYKEIYGSELEHDVKGDTSGTFKRLLVSLCNTNRDESMQVHPEDATADAQALFKAGEKHLGTHESTFISILCQHNYEQLKLIFNEYECITGHDIEKAIKKEFSGNAEDALLAVIRCVKNKPQFFAKCLHESMAGLGTKDRELIRIIVTRCEIDMGDIKREYQEKYGKSLAHDIKGDTSGDYEKCLLALIGED